MEPDRGCRCRDPKLSSWGRCLHCLGMVVCACLFLLGFLMCRLAVEYKDQYGTGQWLSSLAQGSAIMLVSLAGLADSVYATRCIGSNFGFLTHISGRAVFYIMMGFYALPVTQTLWEVRKHPGQDSFTAAFALIGVILAFVAGLVHCIFICRGGASVDRKHLGSSEPPEQVGATQA
uniref:MARVEL domain-containing protein n=1 Tax=Alexandrium catenella TaxID=2925 RepID=A0A7S1Q4Z1_ALECA